MRTVWTWLIRAILLTGVIALLAWQASQMDMSALRRILMGDVGWHLLAAALATYGLSVFLTFVRWWCLIQTLQIPISLHQTCRWGLLGYFMQFLSLGSLGGDIFKAVLVARGQAGRRMEAVSTVIVDRLIGFLSLLLLAAIAFAYPQPQHRWPREISRFAPTFWLAAMASVVVMQLLLRTRLQLRDLILPFGRWLRWTLPIMVRVDGAMQQFRNRHWVIMGACGLGILSHLMQATTLYLIASAIASPALRWHSQLCIWPLAAMAGALPITPAGLGTFDAAYAYLYDGIAHRLDAAPIGLMVAMGFRIICLLVAALGMLIFATSQSEIQAARDDAQV